MSIELAFAQQRLRDMQNRVHTFVSSVGNALERISILIDEDEPDDAKREIEELRAALGRIDDDRPAPEPMPNTHMQDSESHLALLWWVIWQYEDALNPGDEVMDEIKTVMAWIREDLDLPDLVETEN